MDLDSYQVGHKFFMIKWQRPQTLLSMKDKEGKVQLSLGLLCAHAAKAESGFPLPRHPTFKGIGQT